MKWFCFIISYSLFRQNDVEEVAPTYTDDQAGKL